MKKQRSISTETLKRETSTKKLVAIVKFITNAVITKANTGIVNQVNLDQKNVNSSCSVVRIDQLLYNLR